MDRYDNQQQFETTHWSIVVSSRNRLSEIRRESLEQLCEAYWYPLFAYLRRAGHAAESSADYVQGFFLELIDKDFLQSVSPDKGRFRWFLMSAIKRYVARQVEKQTALKRGGGRQILSLNIDNAEQRYQMEPVNGWTAEKLYDRRWAMTVLQQALANLRDEHEKKGKLDLYLALQPTLTGSQMTKGEYAEIGDRFGLLADTVKVAASRLRLKYRDSIRSIVAQTVVESDQIPDEIDELLAALRTAP